MKNRIWLAFATLLLVAISLPVFVSAQNQGSSTSLQSLDWPWHAPRSARPRTSGRVPSNATAATERDSQMP